MNFSAGLSSRSCRRQSGSTRTLGCACQIIVSPASLPPVTGHTQPRFQAAPPHFHCRICTPRLYPHHLLARHHWSPGPPQDYIYGPQHPVRRTPQASLQLRAQQGLHSYPCSGIRRRIRDLTWQMNRVQTRVVKIGPGAPGRSSLRRQRRSSRNRLLAKQLKVA